ARSGRHHGHGAHLRTQPIHALVGAIEVVVDLGPAVVPLLLHFPQLTTIHCIGAALLNATVRNARDPLAAGIDAIAGHRGATLDRHAIAIDRRGADLHRALVGQLDIVREAGGLRAVVVVDDLDVGALLELVGAAVLAVLTIDTIATILAIGALQGSQPLLLGPGEP